MAPGISHGDIPVQVPNTDSIQTKVLEQSLDITEKAERPQAKLGITVSFGPPRDGQPLFNEPATLPISEQQAESGSDSDSNASLDNSEAGEEAEGHLAYLLAVARATIFTCGKGPTTMVHLSMEDSDSANLTSCIPMACGARVFRKSAVVETAENFVIGKHKEMARLDQHFLREHFFRELMLGCQATSGAAPAWGAKQRQLWCPPPSFAPPPPFLWR